MILQVLMNCGSFPINFHFKNGEVLISQYEPQLPSLPITQIPPVQQRNLHIDSWYVMVCNFSLDDSYLNLFLIQLIANIGLTN